MASNHLTPCKSCGQEIDKRAKICPNCGAKNQKPFYKRVWFWILAVLILLWIFGSSSDSETPQPPDNTPAAQTSDAPQEPEISYTVCSADDLMNLLNQNALKAKQTYLDVPVELTGRLAVIDSSGSYISLLPRSNEFAVIGVQCYLRDDAQLDIVANLEIDDTVTVQGTITAVGEVMGYTLKIDRFV